MAIIRSILDTDLYKLSMAKAVLDHFPGVPVDYKFFNRRPVDFGIPGFLDRLEREIEQMAFLKLRIDEMEFLRGKCPFLGESFLKWLKDFRFDPLQVRANVVNGQLDLAISGPWEEAIFWEVPLLALISEVYYSLTDPDGAYSTCAEATFQKRHLLTSFGIPFAEFGTRRRRKFSIQESVISLLKNSECFVGTSNVHLACCENLRPIGTMAHEWIMGVSAMDGLRHANRHAMRRWGETFQGNLGIVLTDTFGTRAFWEDFDGYFARLFDGIRHDSGDPIRFGDIAINHYRSLGIDPRRKVIIFSDGLDCEKAIKIHKHFAKRINVSFGIGTFFTNDVPNSPALNIVIKLTSCNGIPVVKLSDVSSKATGDKDALRVARWTFFREPIDSIMVKEDKNGNHHQISASN